MIKWTLFCVIVVGLVNGAKLPGNIHLCQYEDTTCLLEAINDAIPKLYKGNHDLNLIPFDPLQVDRIVIDQKGSTSAVAIKLSFVNSKIHGIKDIHIESISPVTKTPKGFHLKIKGLIKQVRLVGDYDVDGKVLILPLTGKGPYSLTLDNLKVDIALIGEDEPVIKKGAEYLKLKNFSFKFQTDKMSLHFDGLHGGDKVLGDSTNAFLNENWRDLLVELQPSFESAFSQIFTELTNRCFAKVAYSDVFLN